MLRAEVGLLLRRLYRRAGAPAGGDQPDAALLERFAHGRDEGAFAALVERHGPLVFGVCRRVLRHQQDAEDTFQATFLILARRAASVARGEALAPWLHTVAYRLALRARADAARRPATEPRDLDMLPAKPDSAAGWRDLRPILDEELQRLPEKYRKAVVLCYLEGHTHAEAARQLGWPAGTVAGRLARARALLRDRLERRGVTLSAGLMATVLAEQARAAPVPAALMRITIQNAVAFATASTAAGISANVAALTEGGLQAMVAAKLKVGALVLGVVLVLGGAGVWAQQALSTKPDAEARQATAPPKAVEGGQQGRVDRYGDALPPGAVARLGTVRWRGGRRGNLVFSPDGKILASGRGHWDVSTGRQIRRLGPPNVGGRFSSFNAVAFSADGKSLFSIEEGVLGAWDVATGQELRQHKLSSTPQTSTSVQEQALLSPDGKLFVASARAGEMRLYEAETGKELRVLEESKARFGVRINAFSPDGRFVAAHLSGSTSPDDKPIWEATHWLWDVATGKRVRRLGEPRKVPYHPNWSGAAFSWDGRLLATGSLQEGSIRLWDMATGAEVRSLAGPPGPHRQLAFTRDGKRLIVTGKDGPIRVWDVATGQEVRSFGDGSEGFGLSPDDRLVAVTRDNAIHVWEVATGKEVSTVEGHDKSVWAVTFLSDGRTVGSSDWRVVLRAWDAPSGRPLGVRKEEGGLRFCFSADGELFAHDVGLESRALAVQEVATGKELRQIKLRVQDSKAPMSAYGMALSPDNKLLAFSFGDGHPEFGNNPPLGTLGIWEVATGKEVYLRTGKSVPAGQGSLVFSPDGRVLAFQSALGGSDGAGLWGVASGQPLYQLAGVGRHAVGRALAFSPDGRLLVTSGRRSGDENDNVLSLWEVASGKERGVLGGLPMAIHVAAFSPDGRTLALGGYHSVIRLYDVATCRERAILQGHTGSVYCLAFSRDGRYLVSGSEDTSLLVWDMASVLGPPAPPRVRPSVQEVETAWAALAADAEAAHKAIHTLASAPEQSLPLLRQRLRPAPAIPAEMLKQWVKELDDARFPQRDLAGRQLEAAGAAAEPLLKQALAGQPSAELRQRVEQLLKKLQGPVGHPEMLRSLRAAEVLEHVGTADARALLKALAAGAPEARQTREAKAALQRLATRPTSTP